MAKRAFRQWNFRQLYQSHIKRLYSKVSLLSSTCLPSDLNFIGRIKDVMDLFTHSPAELSKRCRISPSDLKIITNLYCKHLVVAPRTLGDVLEQQGGDQKFTTGDEGLDRVLGGGIRTGIVWEFVGQRLVRSVAHQLRLCLCRF